MATLYVSEYSGAGFERVPGHLPVAAEPAMVDQTVAIAGVSAASAAFGASTRVIRVHTDAICSILVGTGAPIALTTSKRLPANWTEYFSVQPGDKIAVISNT